MRLTSLGQLQGDAKCEIPAAPSFLIFVLKRGVVPYSEALMTYFSAEFVLRSLAVREVLGQIRQRHTPKLQTV